MRNTRLLCLLLLLMFALPVLAEGPAPAKDPRDALLVDAVQRWFGEKGTLAEAKQAPGASASPDLYVRLASFTQPDGQLNRYKAWFLNEQKLLRIELFGDRAFPARDAAFLELDDEGKVSGVLARLRPALEELGIRRLDPLAIYRQSFNNEYINLSAGEGSIQQERMIVSLFLMDDANNFLGCAYLTFSPTAEYIASWDFRGMGDRLPPVALMPD